MSPNRLAALAAPLLLAAPATSAPASGSPPVAVPGGPYVAECAGARTLVPVDGTASHDPDGTELEYHWISECPHGAFEDPTRPVTNFVVELEGGGCGSVCTHVELRVASGGEESRTPFSISLVDTTAPAVVAPPDLTDLWGMSLDPQHTGTAASADLCDPAPWVSYVDTAWPGEICSGIEMTVQRDWTAVDACGNSATATQWLTLLSPSGGCNGGGGTNLELNPYSCKNEIDPSRKRGYFRAALLGRGEFRIEDVDLSSVRLFRPGMTHQRILPVLPELAPRGDFVKAAAFEVEQCSPAGQDGHEDVVLTFMRRAVVQRLGLDQLPSGARVTVGVIGTFHDGTPFWAADELRIH